MSEAQPYDRLRLDDELDGAAPPAVPLALSPLVGRWRNTDRGASGGISRLVISDRRGTLYVQGFGVQDPEPLDWGETEAVVFAPTVDGDQAWAFNCRFDFGFLHTEVSGYNKEGIVVIVTFNYFHDDSGRADYWTREFFHPEAA